MVRVFTWRHRPEKTASSARDSERRNRRSPETHPADRLPITRRPISPANLGFLTLYNNHPSNIPVEGDEFLIDSPQRIVLSGPNAPFDVGKKTLVIAGNLKFHRKFSRIAPRCGPLLSASQEGTTYAGPKHMPTNDPSSFDRDVSVTDDTLSSLSANTTPATGRIPFGYRQSPYSDCLIRRWNGCNTFAT